MASAPTSSAHEENGKRRRSPFTSPSLPGPEKIFPTHSRSRTLKKVWLSRRKKPASRAPIPIATKTKPSWLVVACPNPRCTSRVPRAMAIPKKTLSPPMTTASCPGIDPGANRAGDRASRRIASIPMAVACTSALATAGAPAALAHQ